MAATPAMLPPATTPKPDPNHHMRFQTPHLHLVSAFGPGWFGEKAEKFARFFGTPTFLISQTVVVFAWILANVVGWLKFDIYPFILLNLAFSLQSAYAAPLILLAQAREADRDKALAAADAEHREDLARASSERQNVAAHQGEQLLELLRQNTELTRLTQQLTTRIEELTGEIHRRTCVGQM
jgi:uncharacterized membrane protein